jgi:hypothetical protein
MYFQQRFQKLFQVIDTQLTGGVAQGFRRFRVRFDKQTVYPGRNTGTRQYR